MAHATVLVVDDDGSIRGLLRGRLEAAGHHVVEAENGHSGLERLPDGVDVVLLECSQRDTDGMSVLRKIRQFDQDLPVILLSITANSEMSADAMSLGAVHLAPAPFNLDAVATVVTGALEHRRLKRDVRLLRANAAQPYTLHHIVGSSGLMTSLRHLVARVASSPGSTVLITGESGTGKDLVARVIHYSSERAPRPFLKIACPALPDRLLERELFGYERGAFADAHAQKKGLLEAADGGTLVLDEIADMAPALQLKLLRVLEEKTFKRVGGTRDVHLDVRIVAATRRNLEADVAAGRFRSDLFYRLHVLPIATPPLRAHLEDIPLLVEYFIERFNGELHKRVLGANPAAYTALQGYSWPGNVRELRNVVERAMLLCEGERLDVSDFRAVSLTADDGHVIELPATGLNLEELEKSLVLQAVRRCGGNQTRAGALLGLNRDQIRYRVEKFGLNGNRQVDGG